MADRCLLYYITDRRQFRGDENTRCRAILGKIAEAARAGVDYIQLREKDLSARDLQSLAEDAVRTIREQRTANGEPGTRLLINSRADIAIAAGAVGIHLRSEDVSPAEVQRIWAACGASAPAREQPCIAVSCHRKDDIDRAQSQGADFAVFAPVFEKTSAPQLLPAGLVALQQVCEVKIPVLALGGVTVKNAAACLRAGAAGIAAIRLFQENKIEDVARALRAL